MYILMRGKVTIYIHYAKKGDDDEKDQAPTIAEKEGKEVNIRQQLGTYVCSLGKITGCIILSTIMIVCWLNLTSPRIQIDLSF